MITAILVCSGLWMLFFTFASHTENFISAAMFKITPFLLGVSLLAIAAHTSGLITLNI